MELRLKESFLNYYNQDIQAKTAVAVLKDAVPSFKDIKKLIYTRDTLLKTFEHNVVVRNTLNFLFYNLSNLTDISKKSTQITRLLSKANHDMAKIASKKIRPGSTIFAHSINNQVFGALSEAAKHKKYYLNLVEHAPFYFGNALTKALFNKELKIALYPDLAIHDAITNSDICLLGAEVITKTSVILKTGSKITEHLAKKKHIPLYICTHTLKFDNSNYSISLLKKEHKENTYHNQKTMFEILPLSQFSGIITEYGIQSPKNFLKETKLHNPWLFMH